MGTPQGGFDFGGIERLKLPATGDLDFSGIKRVPSAPPATAVSISMSSVSFPRPVLRAQGFTEPESVRVTEPSIEDITEDPIGKLAIRAAKKLSPVLHAIGNWIAPQPEPAAPPAPATPPPQTVGRVLSSAGQIMKGAAEFPVRVVADVSGVTQAIQEARGQEPTGTIAPGIAAQLKEGAARVKAAATKLAQAKTAREQDEAVNALMFHITALPADTVGIPVSEVRDSITRGDYTRAAGLALGTAAVFGAVPAIRAGVTRATRGVPVEVRAGAERVLTGEPRDLRAEAAARAGTAKPETAPAGFDFSGVARAGESTAVAGPEFAPVEPPARRVEPRPAPVPAFNPDQPIPAMENIAAAAVRMRAENPQIGVQAERLGERMRAAVPQGSAPDEVARAGVAPVYAKVDAATIRLDPSAYQFKASDVRGETGRLRGVKTWDELQAQTTPVLLHERLDGSLFVADGHQRVNLAQRLEAEGQQVPPLNAVILREADGWTASEVRRTAALINIRQDNASPIDIAKLLRERPLTDADRASIPRSNVFGERFRQAEDLARLGDAAFTAVVNGEVEPAFARFVGRHIDDPAEQLAAIRALRDADLPNGFQAEQFVKGLKSDEFTRAVQNDLFGEQTVAASLARERAQILDAVRRQLASQKSAFGNALRNQVRLETAGNVLAASENERLAGEAARFRGLLDAFVDKAGQTAQALKEGARKVADGQAKPADIVPDVIAALERDWREAEGGTGPLRPTGVRPEDQGRGGPGGELPPTAEQSPVATPPPVAPEPPPAAPRAEDLTQYSTGEHQSSLPVGTRIELMREGTPQVAVKAGNIPNGEEWRIHTGHRMEEGGGYVYSEGWRYVREHAVGRPDTPGDAIRAVGRALRPLTKVPDDELTALRDRLSVLRENAATPQQARERGRALQRVDEEIARRAGPAGRPSASLRQVVGRALASREWTNPDARPAVTRIFNAVADELERGPRTIAQLRAAGSDAWVRQALDALKEAGAVETRWDRDGEAYHVKAGTNPPGLMTEAELPGEWRAGGEARPIGAAPRSLPAPEGWSLVVGKTRTKEGHTYEAEVDWPNKRIVFADQQHLENPEIRNHEIAYVLIETMPDTERQALLDAYVAIKRNTSEWQKHGADWIVKNQFHREEIAMDAGDYVNDPSRISPELRALFDEHLGSVVEKLNRPSTEWQPTQGGTAILQTPSGQPVARLRLVHDEGRGNGTYEVVRWLGGDEPLPYGKGTYADYFRGRVADKLISQVTGKVSREGAPNGYLQLMAADRKYLAPDVRGDILETGEVQPRLPGAESVREQNIPTPEVAEVPFTLNAGKGEGAEQASRAELEAQGQKNLFASMGTSAPRRAPVRPAGTAAEASEGGGLRPPEPPPEPPELRQRITDWLAGKGGAGLVRVANDIETTFAAPTISKAARVAGNLFRMKLGEVAQKGVAAEYALRKARVLADRLTRDQVLDLADAIESGEPVPKAFEAYLRARDRLYAQRKAELARLGIDKEWMEFYLPHAWESGWKGSRTIEGKYLREWFAHRTLEGGKHFLKARKIPTMREGVEAGFDPVSWNLVDLDLLKLREMDKFIFGRELREEMKAQGLITFGSTLKARPEGLVQIEDPIGTVYAPPTVTIKEAFDKQLFEGLQQFASDLGIPHTRKSEIGGKRWGYASTLEGMVTKFGGPETVLMHEIGHFLDFRYGLAKLWIGEHPFSKAAKVNPMQPELRALADLRAESMGTDVPDSFKKYIRRGEEKIANAVHAYIWNPERMRQVAPTVYGSLDSLISQHPELQPLRDLQKTRSLEFGTATVEKRLPGPVLLGHYYARPEVARLFNNYLRPGLSGRSALFDAYRWIGNNLNQVQLGVSAFHAGTSAINAVVSKVALGLEHLAEGRPGTAALKFAEAPFAWFVDVMRGAKAIREYETANPGALTIADSTRRIIEAGGRVRMESMYFNRSLRAFVSALHHPEALRKAGALWHVLPAAVELAAKPVMQWYVPRLKIAAFLDLAEKEIGRLGPAAELADVRDVLARSWDSIDGRFGQLVYENIFWPRIVKDLGMASVRSLGWNLGSFMELGGGFKDIVRRPLPGGREVRMIEGKRVVDPLLSHRTAHLVGLTFTAGLVGALYQLAHTGEWPTELRDYFFPKTGRQKPDGDDERVSLPSYMKDLFSFARGPLTTAGHKLHPELGLLVDTWNNEDYYGNEIRNQDDPWVAQLEQYFTFVGKQFVPISVRAYSQRMQSGATVGGRLESAVGITPASALVSRSAAEERMRNYLGPVHRTVEQAAVAEQRREYRQGLQQGDPERIQAARATGLLTPESIKRMHRERKFTSLDFGFQRLSLDQALHVYEVMTPQERSRFKGRLEMKYRGAHLPPAERAEMRDRMAHARSLAAYLKEPGE
jgi:hypothetical protein